MEPGKAFEKPSIEYKVVELQTVADDMLEQVLNEWTRKGWDFEGLHFVSNEASKRPKMAFVFFTRPLNASKAGFSEKS